MSRNHSPPLEGESRSRSRSKRRRVSEHRSVSRPTSRKSTSRKSVSAHRSVSRPTSRKSTSRKSQSSPSPRKRRLSLSRDKQGRRDVDRNQLFASLKKSLQYISDMKFSLTDLKYLPKTEKINPIGFQEKFKDKIFNIISGTVARGTSATWGIESIDGVKIFDQDDPHINVFTVTETHPSGRGKYKLTYLFMANNRADDLGCVLKRNAAEFSENPCLRSIFDSLRSAQSALKYPKATHYPTKISYEQQALKQIMNLIDNPTDTQNEWFAVLLFSYGDTDEEIEECVHKYAALSACYGVFEEIDVEHDNLDVKFADARKTETTIFCPKILFVGNLEMASSHAIQVVGVGDGDGSDRKDESDLKVRPDDEVRKTFDVFVKTKKAIMDRNFNALSTNEKIGLALKNGSCTLIMSLTMRMLRHQHDFPIAALFNAAFIAGCKCYVTAASVNEMVTITGNNPSDSTNNILRDMFDYDIDNIKIITANHCEPSLVETVDKYVGREYIFIDSQVALAFFKTGRALKLRRDNEIRASFQHPPRGRYETNINEVNEDKTFQGRSVRRKVFQ